MSEYSHVIKGALKLKTESKIMKRSKKHKKHALKSHEKNDPNVEIIEEKNEPKITKTAAEVEFEKKKEKRMMERILTKAEKSHKQRIMEFNEHLNSMSEHFDIPKVSWTK
ncbi:Protein FAM32A [Echinococcus granulosus]|nr:Protein FAM32A [Echinococcus granulosus]